VDISIHYVHNVVCVWRRSQPKKSLIDIIAKEQWSHRVLQKSPN